MHGMLGAILLGEYRLFLTPLPVWNYWYLLMLPLCMGVAIVYKALRIDTAGRLWREAAVIWLWILASMAAGAAILWALVAIVTRMSN